MKPILSVILLCLMVAPICRSKIVDDEGSWSDEDDESNHDSDEHSDEDRDQADDGELGNYARYGPAPVGHNGQVVDTGDVKRAKGRHFQAYAKMASLAAQRRRGEHRGAADESKKWKGNDEHEDNSDAGSLRWTGPFAEVEFTSDGFLKDTPEVARERAKHLQAHAAATALAEQNGSIELNNAHNDRQDGGQNGGQAVRHNSGQRREQNDGQDGSSEQDDGEDSEEQGEY